MGWFRRNEHDEEQLSAYLDGELNARQTENVERHLSVCDACAALLEELRETRTLLFALPAQPPPRSFVLGPEHARAPVRDVARPSKRFNLALAPAAALSVFVALVAVDLGGISSSSSDESSNGFTAATSRQADDATASGGAALEAPGQSESSDSSADGADVDGEPANSPEPATAPDGGEPGSAAGTGPAEGTGPVGPPAIMSAEEAPSPAAEGDSALRSTGEAADEESLPEPIALESPESEEDGGVSTLRILQVLTGAAFLASGFYVFVWPRISREGS